MMVQKTVTNACFCLFFGVLAVTALDKPSCVDEIRKSLQGGRPLMGGWRAVENPENDGDVNGIVASGVKEYNLVSNDLHQYQLYENGGIEAYVQLVNGLNYCVQFHLVSDGCKNSMNADYCRDGTKFICSVPAYKAFNAADAQIDRTKLVCKKDA